MGQTLIMVLICCHTEKSKLCENKFSKNGGDTKKRKKEKEKENKKVNLLNENLRDSTNNLSMIHSLHP